MKETYNQKLNRILSQWLPVGIIAIIILGLCIVIDRYTVNTPCSEYGNYSFKEVPVRCLGYFNHGGN